MARFGTYLRNFIMRTVTRRTDLIVWSIGDLLLHLMAPWRLHPRVLFAVHETDRYIVLSSPINRDGSRNLSVEASH